MDQQPVLIKRPCQRAHQRGQEEVIAVCLNKECRQRLCCINCRKEGDHQGHLGDICHFDFLSDQLEEEFTAYKSVGILSLIEGKIQEFNKVKAEFLKAFDLLETDFLKRVQRVREVDLLIRESIKMVETKVFELFTEIQSQALVELKDNSYVERLKRLICEDPLISELQQLNKELVSKIQATKIAKFIQKRSSDPLQVECFFQNSLSFDQIPIEMKLIIEERIEETNEGNQFFLGGFQSNLKHGRGILVKQDCQEIIEGIWENDSIKWGIKVGKSKKNQNINYHYVGMLQNDNREGKGMNKYSNGDSYEGDWKNDKKEGKGIYKNSNGNSYEGDWKNNKREGKGIYKDFIGGSYEGDWKNNKREGKGIYKDSNGDSYEGNWKNDKREGKGIYKWATGDSYEGDWKNDKREGKGIYKDFIGGSYEGDWKNNKREGKGIYKDSNGNSYEGDWKNDNLEGKGIYKDSNGNSYEGDWKNDNLEGKGIYKDSIGDSYEGDWKNNKREGKGIYKDFIGGSYEGDWKNNKREGKGIYKDSNGDSYEGDWKNDKREGKGIYKWATGDSYEGDWKNDKREGKGIYKWATGSSYEGDWKNNKKEGKGIFKFSNGNIEEGHYEDGLSIGEHKVHKPISTKPYKINIYGQDGKFQEEKMLE